MVPRRSGTMARARGQLLSGAQSVYRIREDRRGSSFVS